jgi:hypothetical protein
MLQKLTGLEMEKSTHFNKKFAKNSTIPSMKIKSRKTNIFLK